MSSWVMGSTTRYYRIEGLAWPAALSISVIAPSLPFASFRHHHDF